MKQSNMLSALPKRSSILLILCIVLSLFFSSCAHLEKEPVRDEKETFIDTAQNHLSKGEFQKAIETYQIAYSKYSTDPVLRSNYVKALEYIKRNADMAFEREDYSPAGYDYRVLLNQYAHFTDFIDSLSFNKDFLSNRIDTCSKILNERGLVEYRKGNLEEAISIWKGILKFDPENEDVRRSIATATIQLKTLQK